MRLVFVVCCALALGQQKPLLDALLKDYDASERPLWNVSAVQVNVSLTFVSLFNIDSRASSFELSLYLRSNWFDPRLVVPDLENDNGIDSIQLSCDRVWHPDLFLHNAIDVDPLLEPACKLYANGEMLFAKKMATKLRSNFKLQEFPFDTQLLTIDLMSFRYSEEQLLLALENSSLWSPEPQMDSSVFVLESGTTHIDSFLLRPNDDAFSRIRATLIIERRYANYILKFILPLSLLIMLSQLLYYIDLRSPPARVAGSVTLLLTTSTFNLLVSNDVPKLNYPTVLDIFVMVAFIFALLTCLEYIGVQFLLNKYSYSVARRLDYYFRIAMLPNWICTVFAIFIPGLWPSIVFPLLILIWSILCGFITHNRSKKWDARRKIDAAATPLQTVKVL